MEKERKGINSNRQFRVIKMRRIKYYSLYSDTLARYLDPQHARSVQQQHIYYVSIKLHVESQLVRRKGTFKTRERISYSSDVRVL